MKKSLKCWQCQHLLQDEKIGFRSICDHCFAEQHACVNCKHYAIGKPNDCSLSGTEPVSKKDRMNFCDEFTLNQNLTNTAYPESAKKIFNEEIPKRKTFEELFND